MDTLPTEPPCTISSHSNTADNSTTSKDSLADSVLEDLVLRLGHFLVTEEYEDGQPSSTLLVYFSSVLDISADGSTFERAVNYTPKLSGMIYCARLIFLESTLARFAHNYIGWKARPRRGQLDHLNEVRREKMCLGSQAPMGEFLSLRTYGRACSRSDGPSFHVNWSDDGQVVSWDEFQLSMAQFRQISQSTLDCAAMVCKRLMYDWCPSYDLNAVKDKLSNTARGYSFVSDPANGLSEAYLDLSRRACLATIDGLMTDAGWDVTGVRRYLDWQVDLLQLIMVLVYRVWTSSEGL